MKGLTEEIELRHATGWQSSHEPEEMGWTHGQNERQDIILPKIVENIEACRMQTTITLQVRWDDFPKR